MRLSQNFTLAEFLVSDTAARMGRKIEADPIIVSNLKYGATHVMQPIRNIVGGPLIINSGYRPPWLNRKIGGSKKSQHMHGLAADFRVLRSAKVTLLALARKIEESNIPYDQLIYETGTWIHVSWRVDSSKNRGQVLTMYKKPGLSGYRTKYVTGLHSIDSLLARRA